MDISNTSRRLERIADLHDVSTKKTNQDDSGGHWVTLDDGRHVLIGGDSDKGEIKTPYKHGIAITELRPNHSEYESKRMENLIQRMDTQVRDYQIKHGGKVVIGDARKEEDRGAAPEIPLSDRDVEQYVKERNYINGYRRDASNPTNKVIIVKRSDGSDYRIPESNARDYFDEHVVNAWHVYIAKKYA